MKEIYIKSFYTNQIEKRVKEKGELAEVSKFISRAVKLAYSDAARACEGIGKHETAKENALKAITKKLEKFVANGEMNQVDFDDFHASLCDIWRATLPGDLGNVGKAQKVVNMSFKYIYTYIYEKEGKNAELLKKFQYCHFTLDSYTLKWLLACKMNEQEEKIDVSKYIFLNTETKWSKLTENSDDSEYCDLRDYARHCVGKEFKNSLTPLQAEFVIWEGVNLFDSIRAGNKAISDFSDNEMLYRMRIKEQPIDDDLLSFIRRLI